MKEGINAEGMNEGTNVKVINEERKERMQRE